jgi:hypothetical protein
MQRLIPRAKIFRARRRQGNLGRVPIPLMCRCANQQARPRCIANGALFSSIFPFETALNESRPQHPYVCLLNVTLLADSRSFPVFVTKRFGARTKRRLTGKKNERIVKREFGCSACFKQRRRFARPFDEMRRAIVPFSKALQI